MRLAKGLWTAYVLAFAMGAPCVYAQTPSSSTSDAAPQSTQDALHAIAQMAGIIFAGQVVAVRPLAGVIEIDFAVEDAVLGVTGSSYTLREWAGLWAAGDQPFRVGQRYLMLLHAPGVSGLSSPVGGMDGAIPIRGSGQDTNAQDTTSLSALITAQTIDLRWIATRVVQPLAYQATFVTRPTALPSPVHPNAVVAASFADAKSATPGSAVVATSAPAQAASYSNVIAMLRSWEAVDHATR